MRWTPGRASRQWLISRVTSPMMCTRYLHSQPASVMLGRALCSIIEHDARLLSRACRPLSPGFVHSTESRHTSEQSSLPAWWRSPDEQVIDRVNAAAQRVLDWQHCPVHQPLLQSLEGHLHARWLLARRTRMLQHDLATVLQPHTRPRTQPAATPHSSDCMQWPADRSHGCLSCRMQAPTPSAQHAGFPSTPQTARRAWARHQGRQRAQPSRCRRLGSPGTRPSWTVPQQLQPREGLSWSRCLPHRSACPVVFQCVQSCQCKLQGSAAHVCPRRTADV